MATAANGVRGMMAADVRQYATGGECWSPQQPAAE